jgi:uncharacterized protein (TIGR02246 family)
MRVLAVSLLTAACASAPASAPADAVTAIPAMLHASAASWNDGDLDGFLDDYLDSPETAFVGANVSLGTDEIRQRYLQTFWKTGRPEQTLRFEDLHVRPLGDDHALARGVYVLTDAAGAEAARGRFSLVLVHTSSGWRIIHDHSS